MKLTLHESGYLRVTFRKNDKNSYHYAHVIVMTSWTGNRPNKQDVDHIDKNRTNNKLSNLRWLPYRLNRGKSGNENGNSRIKAFKRNGYHKRGERCAVAKLKDVDIRQIRKMLIEGVSNVEIARSFNITPDNISKIKRGLTWKHVK